MATALARGFGEPVLVADVDRSRAEALAQATGGQALGSNREVAEQADAVVLCHKPAQLEDVALEIRDSAKVVVSILGGTPLAALELAYPDRPVYRFMPNIPAEVKPGRSRFCPGTRAADGPQAEILELFERAGTVTELPEGLIDVATAINGLRPGRLRARDRGADRRRRAPRPDARPGREAVDPDDGRRGRGHRPRRATTRWRCAAASRRRAAAPRARLEALERGGVRAAFADAVGAVVEMTR